METGSKNKMVTGSTKGAKNKAEKHTYHFPSLGISVEAESIEEATKIANQENQ